jgi:hypothetical protein
VRRRGSAGQKGRGPRGAGAHRRRRGDGGAVPRTRRHAAAHAAAAGHAVFFLRKYLWRPAREALRDEAIRDAALAAGGALGVDWAARVDFTVRDGRPHFLECNAAPLVGPDSAFAASFAAAGVKRVIQLAWLTSYNGE